jgi:hypothetical protein
VNKKTTLPEQKDEVDAEPSLADANAHNHYIASGTQRKRLKLEETSIERHALKSVIGQAHTSRTCCTGKSCVVFKFFNTPSRPVNTPRLHYASIKSTQTTVYLSNFTIFHSTSKAHTF